MFLPREPKPGQKLSAAWGAAVIRYLRSVTVRSSIDCEVDHTANGTRIRPRPTIDTPGGEAVAPIVRPFDVSILPTEDEDVFEVVVQPGLANNRIPTNMFSHTMTVPAEGVRYIVLTSTFTAGSITGANLSVETTAPDPYDVYEALPPPGAATLIAIIIDATVAAQIIRGNLSYSTHQIFTSLPDPPADPGELPYVPWYRWVATTDNS